MKATVRKAGKKQERQGDKPEVVALPADRYEVLPSDPPGLTDLGDNVLLHVGRGLMLKLFAIRGVEFSEEPLERVAQSRGWASIKHLYYALGEGHLEASDVFAAAFGRDFGLPEVVPLFDENEKAGYTGASPPSEAADTPPLRMRDDLNTAVRKAKAENLARGKSRLPATHQLATYRALAQHVDLLNRDLSEDERKRRAKRLVQAYERLRARRPTFHDHKNKQLLAAFSIMNKVKYRRGEAKKAAQKAALAM